MRRLIAILLALACCALAQLPVAWPAAPHRTCCCCGDDGACGMPACPAPPVSTRNLPASIQTVTVAATEARQAVAPARRDVVKFFAAFVASPANPAPTPALGRMTPPASVPRFKAHCSFLI